MIYGGTSFFLNFILFWADGVGWRCVVLAMNGFVLRWGCTGSCLQKWHLQNNNTVKHFSALLGFHRLSSGGKSFPYFLFKVLGLNSPSVSRFQKGGGCTSSPRLRRIIMNLSWFSLGISIPGFAILPIPPGPLSNSVNRPLCGGAALPGD